MSSALVETYRGDVKPWEVDIVEHFTVAFYYEKFEVAAWRFLSQSGVDARQARSVDCFTRYQAELRKGDLFHIESGLIRAGDRPVIGHRMVNSNTGAVCTTMEHTLEGVRLDGPTAAWDGPAREERAPPAAGVTWVRGSTDAVRPGDLDWSGRLGLAGAVHQFSGAGFHLMSNAGMSAAYLREQRIGYSTFEFQLRFAAWPAAGTLLQVDSCVAHVGSSSLRFVHRMTDSMTGELVAELGQFGVHLDMAARRPKRLPDELMANARRMAAMDS